MKLLLDLSARVLALLWAGFWVFFFVDESIEWRSAPLITVAWVSLGLLFVLLALVPWRWEMTGGLLLITAGLLLGSAYAIWSPVQLPTGARVLTSLVFALPPSLSGILFLMHWKAVLHRA